MRTLLQWLTSDEVRRTSHPTRIAAKAHYQFLHIFPFAKHSGKVARLLMNLLLLREGYPPAIVHSTDRQRYYDALKSSSDAVAAIINESLDNAADSATRYWNRLLGIEEESD
jgi:Fic family protein